MLHQAHHKVDFSTSNVIVVLASFTHSFNVHIFNIFHKPYRQTDKINCYAHVQGNEEMRYNCCGDNESILV